MILRGAGEILEPMPPGIEEGQVQSAGEKLRRVAAMVDNVILAAMEGDRNWNTMEHPQPADRRPGADEPQQHEAHPAHVIALQNDMVEEWTARTSQLHSAAGRLSRAAATLRDAVPYMGEEALAPAVQVLQALEAWQQAFFQGIHAVHSETQTEDAAFNVEDHQGGKGRGLSRDQAESRDHDGETQMDYSPWSQHPRSPPTGDGQLGP